MSDEFKPTTVSPESEPMPAFSTLPVWLVVLMLLLLYRGAVFFDQHSGWFESKVYEPYMSLADVDRFQPRSRAGAQLARGKVIFETICALCHNPDGMGKPNQAPPLVGSEWANAENPNRMIRIPLSGLNGPITVKGQQWNLAMPAMGAALADDDLAAVLTYIRQSWGNKASAVTADQIKKIRAEIGNRTQPWTVEELNAIPEK